ncbi:MAG: PAS domain S-box protein, partial [Gemmatimonadetes bacterium]|nr:PAS domain S-box protein [Gemmatimonadota bacterium]
MWAEITLRRVTINGEDRLLATGRATNEWKAAEQALRASEESYRTIFDSTAAAIWVHDLATRELLEVNAAACELYGYTADEQLSIGLAGLVWGEAPYTLEEADRIFDLARAGEPQRFVWLGRHKGGGEVWAEMQARRVAGLGGDRLLVTARGMNEWRAAADALRRANAELEQRVAERTAELAETNVALEEEVAEHESAREELVERTRELEGVFQALPDLYFRMDPDGTITDHRAGRAASLYSPLPSFHGRRLQDLLPPDTAVLFARALDEVGRTGELACVEYSLDEDGRRLEFEARVVPLEDGSRITVVRDITERKAAEAEISRQKVYFEEIIGSLESGVAVFDRDLRYEYCSPNTIRDPEVRAWVVGHTVEEYGRRIGLSDEVIRERQESVERALAERAMVQFEEEIRRPDGTPRHMLRRALPLLDENGEVMRIIGYSIDISERKRAEEALQRSEEHFRTLIELSHDIITILDAEGRTVYQSPSLQRIMGYAPQELRGISAFDLVHPDDIPLVTEAMGTIVSAPGAIARAEYRYRHKDGSWRRLETFGRSLPHGVTEGVAVFNSRDVTERWEAERTLREREEHFRRMIENASDMVQVIGADMRVSYTGPSVERLLGYTPEEIQGTAAMEYLHPDDIPGTLEHFAAMLANPGVPVTAEYRVRHKEGGWRDFEAQAMTLASDTAEDGIVVNARDITERRRTQEALRRSEEHFRALIENAHDVITILDADGFVTYQSPSLARVAGYSPEERDGTHVLELVHPDDVETVTRGIAGVMEVPGTVGRVEFRFRHKDGRWLRLEALGRTLSPESVAQGLVFNTRDITERWEIEQALQAREERFRRMIENASDLVQVVGADTQIVYTGPSVERILGFTPEEIGGISALDYIHPDDIAGALKQFEKIVSNPGSLFGAEYRALHKDGRWRNMEAKGMTMLPDSAAEGVIVNARDVTERKATEEALQRSEEHFRALIENGTDYLMIVAPDTRITYVGPSVKRLLGYTPEEMLGRVAPDLVHPDDLPHVRQVMAELVAEPGKVKRAAWRIRHRDGGWREYEAYAKTLLPDSPEAGIVVNGRDMTERNAVERALQRSEEHFRALIENAHDLTAIIDASGRFVYQSPSMERIYGRVPGETLGHTAWELMHADDVPAVKAEFARVLANPGSIGHVEYRYRHKDGGWIYTEAFGRTLLPDSAEQGVVVNARDVTERRLAEEALRRATADAE